MIGKLYLYLCVAVLLFSCGTRRNLVYFQNNENQKQSGANRYEVKIQPDDLLYIYITAQDQEVANPFNFVSNTTTTSTPNQTNTTSQNSYLVDNAGNITFPILGLLKVAGLTRTELIAMFTEKLKTYILEPGINFRITNYKVSVLGEVANPGTVPISSERLTLPEALSIAGDLTIYGKRENILIVRETEGQKSFTRVDITQADFVNSPFYYLAQNDVVYVEPNATKIRSSAIGPNISLVLTVATSILTIITLLTIR